MIKVLWACVLLVAVAGSVCSGGEVLLSNGDRLTGVVEKIVEGKLYFTSDLVGAVTIDMKNVKTFSMDEAGKIALSDGTVLNQQIGGSGEGRVSLAGGEIIKGQDIALSDIASLNAPDEVPPKWNGSISVAWTSVHGNTKSETLGASMNTSLRREKDRTSLWADYGRSKQENPDTGEETTTEDWWKTRGKYDFFLTEKLYGFVDGRYETDKIAELDRRVIIGSGLGYQWIESANMNFSSEAGLANLSERYLDGSSNNSVSAQAGYHFDVKLTEKIDFINDLTYYPSIEDFADYYLTTTAELRTYLTENMFANLKVIFDYDSSPAQGKGGTDVRYILGVGWNF